MMRGLQEHPENRTVRTVRLALTIGLLLLSVALVVAVGITVIDLWKMDTTLTDLSSSKM